MYSACFLVLEDWVRILVSLKPEPKDHLLEYVQFELDNCITDELIESGHYSYD